MNRRLVFAGCSSALIALIAVPLGYRWVFLVAALSAAVLFIVFGWIDHDIAAHPRWPQGVHIVHADGSVTPCELAYAGINEFGWHEWTVTTEVHVGDTIRCDEVFGPTVISATVTDDVAGARLDGHGYRMEGHG